MAHKLRVGVAPEVTCATCNVVIPRSNTTYRAKSKRLAPSVAAPRASVVEGSACSSLHSLLEWWEASLLEGLTRYVVDPGGTNYSILYRLDMAVVQTLSAGAWYMQPVHRTENMD